MLLVPSDSDVVKVLLVLPVLAALLTNQSYVKPDVPLLLAVKVIASLSQASVLLAETVNGTGSGRIVSTAVLLTSQEL
jgi:hypothetical protein